MSWSCMRDSSLRRFLSAQYGRIGSQYSPPDLLFDTEPENLPSTNDSSSADEDFDSLVLFGMLRGNVVGLRYYTGVVNNNEMVALQREPKNQYDRNAVKVNNVNGEQVGHIKKELAAALAPIMDRKKVKMEGTVPFGANNAFTMPVNLSFWGREENKTVVMDHMKKYGFKLGPLPQSSQGLKGSSFSPKSQPRLGAPSLPAVQMTTEQLKTEFDKLFEDLKEDDKTRELDPSKAVETSLLPHQKQALAWMVSRENSKELPPFWEQRNNFYYCTLTNFAEKDKPETLRGGLLADDMGLGKTLSIIALILTNFHDGKPFPVGHGIYGKSSLDEKSLVQDDSRKSSNKKPSRRKTDETNEKPGSSKGETLPKRQKATFTLSDSEEDEWIPRKGKAPSACNVVNDQFAMALFGNPPAVKQKTKKEGTAPPACNIVDDDQFSMVLFGTSIVAKKSTKKKSTDNPTKCEVQKRPRTTLIICPLSVLSNWIDQFEQHVKADAKLNIYIYYGPERNKNSDFLSKQDVVLTTYNVVTYDYANESPLHKIRWLRVVLDEGHTIRNPNAQQTKAVHNLDSERRWVLTGTPIQNSLKDLWSILSFLKLKPFTDREWWHRAIERPVRMGDEGGLRRLQALIKNITLRRTKTTKVKGKPVLQLPERKVYVQHIKLSSEERKIYESMQNEGKVIISRYFNEGTVLTHYADVLAVLVRLRQICCHPHLVSTSLSNSLSAGSTPDELREKLVNKIKMVLSSGSDEECSICLESLNMPVITRCAHVFCKECICQVIHRNKPNPKCPMCRGELYMEHLLECPEDECDPSDRQNNDQKWMSSSKISALMHALTEEKKKDPHVKSIIVSQFTAFLSLIQTALRESSFTFTRLDGSMNQKKRTEAIQSFQSSHKDSPTIMLLSLKAGGVGLNLTAASRVFLMDPAWNPAAEEQCFDRCHRLGQTKEVIVTKFVVKNSVEENMLKIQDKKRELASGAFGGNKPTSSEMKQARINEIRTLVDL
ncbi:helicase-like transcription factor isoform X2 [Rana temporaria]|uniref:helicase-like transcription factor isoform X2 n=1 Tax=Rana temporaria TaxID=8407 RepID=UPI001AAD6ED1|nr:helicase-like transcription factor isoform X2 [Rana temporaria]